MNFLHRPAVLLVLNLLLFVALSWFVVNRLFVQNDFKNQGALFVTHIQGRELYLLLLSMLLMPVNWLLETLKWRILLSGETNFRNLLKSVIAGITVGFVTPGRTGEFLGRVLFLDEENKTRAFYLSSLGGFAQTAASLMIGAPLVYWWSNSLLLTYITVAFAVIYLLIYFRFDWLNRFISSLKLLQRYQLTIGREELPGADKQIQALLLSAIRFVVYLSQYVLLLSFFGLGNDYPALFVHSAVFLLAQTFSPLMPLLDVSFRSGTALYVFQRLTDNNLAVLSAVTAVWLLNLVIPALAGYFFIFRKAGGLSLLRRL